MPAPGQRRKEFYSRTPTKWGMIQENLRVWLDSHLLTGKVYIMPTPDDKIDTITGGEVGHNVIVFLKTRSGQTSINLTAMTADELNAAKEFFDTAFATAQPIVSRRDAQAQEALDDGDDTYDRVYRAVPRIIEREGPQFIHREELLHGHDWVPPVDSFVVSPRRRPGSEGLGVPERDPSFSGTEDHTEETEQPPSLRQANGQPVLPSRVQGTEASEGGATPLA